MLNKAFWQQHQVLLAWSLLALLLVIGLFLVVIPSVQKSWELSERIETGYQQLTRFRQMAAATPEFMAEYERVQQNGLDKLFYPAGMTSAQVAKELQKNLATVIIRDNGVLLSSEVLDAQQTEAEQANTVSAGDGESGFSERTGVIARSLASGVSSASAHVCGKP